MTRPRNVQDPVWGQIDLTEEEWKVINLPLFQRLRRIHQLGLTLLVFPGATHSRFEHSIGSAHAASRIAERLEGDDESEVRFGEDDRRLVRLAALLHDIGHGPFSHVADVFLNRGGRKGHEWIGAELIVRTPELRAVLGDDTVQAIAALLTEDKRRSVQRDIVAGPVDADKTDYLRRDSHYAGTPQGIFDYHHFIDQATTVAFPPESQLGFRWGGLWAVEGMLLARHHMHRTVYGHHTRLVTEFMTQRGLEAAMGEAGPLPVDLLTLPEEGDDVERWLAQYVSWDDWRVMVACADASGLAGEMFRCLRDRELLKLWVHLEGDDFLEPLKYSATRALEMRGGQDVGPAVEREVARALGVASDYVIVRIDDPKNPLGRPGTAVVRNEDIVFRTPTGHASLDERSEIFSASPGPRRWRLLVYGPRPEHGQLDAVRARARESVLKSVQAELSGGRA